MDSINSRYGTALPCYLGDDHQNQIGGGGVATTIRLAPSCTELTFLDCELLAY